MLQRRFLGLAALSTLCLLLTTTAPAQDAKQHDAIKPVPKTGGWMNRHKSFNARVKKGDVDLLLIGDSITHGWEGRGKNVWAKFYGKRNAVNLGIGGDRTQHVIWRLDNGNIEGISPKLAVIMIGTNNAGGNTPEQIAEGIKVIVERLRKKLPEMKVLALGIFPRGTDDTDKRRQVNMKTNKIVATGRLSDAAAKPKGLALSADGATLYVATGSGNSVAVLDAETLEVQRSLPVGRRPWGIALSSDGRELYTADGLDNAVSVLDTSSGEVVATIPVGQRPWGIAVLRR